MKHIFIKLFTLLLFSQVISNGFSSENDLGLNDEETIFFWGIKSFLVEESEDYSNDTSAKELNLFKDLNKINDKETFMKVFYSYVKNENNSCDFISQLFLNNLWLRYKNISKIFLVKYFAEKDYSKKVIYRKILIRHGNYEFFLEKLKEKKTPWVEEDINIMYDIISYNDVILPISNESLEDIFNVSGSEIKNKIALVLFRTYNDNFIDVCMKMKILSNTNHNLYDLLAYRNSVKQLGQKHIDILQEIVQEGEVKNSEWNVNFLSLLKTASLSHKTIQALIREAKSKKLNYTSRRMITRFLYNNNFIDYENYKSLQNQLSKEFPFWANVVEVELLLALGARGDKDFLKQVDSYINKEDCSIGDIKLFFNEEFGDSKDLWIKWFRKNKDKFVWDDNEDKFIVPNRHGKIETFAKVSIGKSLPTLIYLNSDEYKTYNSMVYIILYTFKGKNTPKDKAYKIRVEAENFDLITPKIKPLINKYYPNIIFIKDTDF